MKKSLKNMFVKSMALLLFAASAMASLTACGKEEYEGVTVMTSYASDAEVAPLRKIAAAFEKETGIPVKVDYKAGSGGYRQWMLTQFASGRGTDIVMTTRDWADVDVMNEYLYELTDDLDKPNEFFEDKSYPTWRDTFIESAISRSAYSLDSTRCYIVPASMVSVRIMINLDYLEKIGVEEPRRDWTWNEYMDICQKVQDSLKSQGGNMTSVFSCANQRSVDGPVGWAADLIANMLLPDLIEQWDEDKNRSIGCNEMVKIISEGALDYTDPRIMGVFDYIDEWKQYWAPAYNSTDIETSLHAFFKQEAWSYMNGSWSSIGAEKVLNNEFGDAHTYERFRYRSMPFPRLTTENDAHCVYEKVPEVGDVGVSFAVTARAEKRGKAENAVKFLKFLSTQTQIGDWYSDNWNLPAIKGVELNDIIKEFDWAENSEAYAFRMGGATLPDTTGGVQFFNQMQLYLSENISRAEFARKTQNIFKKQVESIAEQYGWDKSNNYGMD